MVLGAGMPDMRTWVGRLDQLGNASIDRSDQAPGTIVVGDVVALRSSLTRSDMSESTSEALVFGRQG